MKVLIITPNIPEYRYEVYQMLAREVDLTILHNGKEINKSEIQFKQIFSQLNRLGPFTYLGVKLNTLCKKFDVIISEANIRHIDRNLLILKSNRTYKWISWGIGVSASYEKKFDSDNSLDWIRHYILKRADANVFYSNYPVNKYIKAGFPQKSLYVANNTTYVSYEENIQYNKNKILFVGTLYKQKRIYELLRSYHEASKIFQDIVPLDIIGSGAEYESIKNWIKKNNLDEKIKLLGPIFDPSLLEEHFRTAYACISPGQAGLSVLTSMGYGTPYITMKEAITGGEIFNIHENDNGILYDSDDELKNIILDICRNPNKFIVMGLKAREYYLKNRKVKDMVNGLKEAINYVVNK